jgi:hypothetical protein
LSEVGPALDRLGLVPDALKSGQQHRQKQRNDRNNHQKFDQGEAASLAHRSISPVFAGEGFSSRDSQSQPNAQNPKPVSFMITQPAAQTQSTTGLIARMMQPCRARGSLELPRPVLTLHFPFDTNTHGNTWMLLTTSDPCLAYTTARAYPNIGEERR